MIGFHVNRSISTKLKLNGPTLGYLQQPTDSIESINRDVTFTAVVNATFPSASGDSIEGTFGFSWYLNNAEVNNDTVSIGVTITSPSSNQSKIVFSNIDTSFDGNEVYVICDYIPASGEPNAINDNLKSDVVTMILNPDIEIVTQPQDVEVGKGSSTTFTVDAQLKNGSKQNLEYQWYIDGQAIIDGTFDGYTYSGTSSDSLSIELDSGLSDATKNVYVEVSHPTAFNSPLQSETVELSVVDPRSIIVLEAYTFDNQYKSQTIDLQKTNTYTVDSSIFGTEYSTIQFHCPEKEVTLQLDMFGAKGTDNNGFSGGNGGQSRVEITPSRNVEYTLIGISNNSGLFLYRGSNLIACVGAGGDAGISANGGDGGGINIPGADGSGRLGGDGGEKINAGTMGLTGSYGSVYASANIDLYPDDSIAQSPEGGSSISCTKGSYWINQGISACSNNSGSQIQFVNVDGTTVSNSSRLIRGFKPGYTISNTSGAGLNNGGDGGSGATGGAGGVSGSGGGGGSGYTNGEVNVVSSSLGGGFGNSRFVISGGFGGFYVDSFGRILILSSTSNRNPNTLPQTTGVVNIGDNAVINDARWQNFLDLARDGTQDYRLTATYNNSTQRITNATPFNIYKMMTTTDGYQLANSLNGFRQIPYGYDLHYLAWDETSGVPEGFGSDYSILAWSTPYGYGYYGQSDISFFSITNHSIYSANWWILPPGVPDF